MDSLGKIKLQKSFRDFLLNSLLELSVSKFTEQEFSFPEYWAERLEHNPYYTIQLQDIRRTKALWLIHDSEENGTLIHQFVQTHNRIQINSIKPTGFSGSELVGQMDIFMTKKVVFDLHEFENKVIGYLEDHYQKFEGWI